MNRFYAPFYKNYKKMEKQDKIQKEILSNIPSNPRCRILVSQRVGKTKLGIDLIERENAKSVLWITPLRRLIDIDIPEDFKKFNKEALLEKVTMNTWFSLSKIEGKFDLIILDESQKITERNSSSLTKNLLKSKSILAMTGTETKEYTKLSIYDKLEMPLTYSYELSDAVKDGIVADYKINIVQIPYNGKSNIINLIQNNLPPIGSYKIIGNDTVGEQLELKMSPDVNHTEGMKKIFSLKKIMSKKGKPMYLILNQYDYSMGYLLLDKLYGKIAEYILDNLKVYRGNVDLLRLYYAIGNNFQKVRVCNSLLKSLKGRTMVFCFTIKQAEALSDCSYHSKSNSEGLEKFLNKESNLITLVNKGGTGVTYREVDNVVILQCNSNKNGGITQQITRAMLKQKSFVPNIWILELESTKDSDWVKASLKDFDQTKIKYVKMGGNL